MSTLDRLAGQLDQAATRFQIAPGQDTLNACKQLAARHGNLSGKSGTDLQQHVQRELFARGVRYMDAEQKQSWTLDRDGNLQEPDS